MVGSNRDLFVVMRVEVHWDVGCVPCARVIAQLGLTLLYVLRERSHGPEREGGREQDKNMRSGDLTQG